MAGDFSPVWNAFPGGRGGGSGQLQPHKDITVLNGVRRGKAQLHPKALGVQVLPMYWGGDPDSVVLLPEIADAGPRGGGAEAPVPVRVVDQKIDDLILIFN